ncbi:LysM peptidoglycan-binding domain-containing protein [Luteolibacter yonseiensis]|uniref:LysM peptidoglycan-binding domain-containing protein n=1 Tax=Luteolibacter yonseiensis TaxID=1144680 RepID=A0A934R1Z3_9BACT|nr:LysM peptidoglycan-binding domain-containing protein [Luteolibacter yonseiensis]MBK1814648.1 LysM peptidoglycan-binding domain-containing protein [Luteolibacter yonseiensis]
MKPVLWTLVSCVFALALSSCGNSGGGGNPQASTGPFDRNGNYVEEWADNPAKWRKSGGSPSPHELKSDELPEIARNDQPPQNSVPLVTSSASVNKPVPTIGQTQIAKNKSTTAKPTQVVVRTRPLETPSASSSKPKPKPKPVLVKAKPKPKPKSTRYVVKQGDSLSAIASRTGASVSAIKAQNGISGTLIRPGQSLVIPKR